MPKRVDLYMVPDDPACQEIKEFLQDKEYFLNIRDINERPLNKAELARLIRHLRLEHFIDTSSRLYSKKGLDKEIPDRSEVIDILAENNELLRKPIIVAGRLMVVGPNMHKIKEMLQLPTNGSDPNSDNGSGHQQRSRAYRADSNHSERSAANSRGSRRS